MASFEELTDPYAATYRNVPKAGPGICEVCHGQEPNPGFATCYSCEEAIRGVSRPVRLIVPISLCERNGQLHHVLRRYKDAWDPATRRGFETQVAAFLGRFLRDHGSCVTRAASSSWDVVVTVPSSRGRSGTHPIETATRRISFLSSQVKTCLAPGPEATDHNRPTDRGFKVTEDVQGDRVLLVDDTYTTGARLQSAASALQLAGAITLAGIVVGRFVNPKRSPTLWERVRSELYDFSRCCLE